MVDQARLVQSAVDVCRKGIAAGQSPFGASIADREGRIVFAAHNTVRLTCDPTAHAEINAIRGACAKLGIIDLSGYVMGSTCEPCPMCATAIHWARLDAVVFGATIDDAAHAGFNELLCSCQQVYELGGSKVAATSGVLRNECVSLFDEWKDGPNPTPY